MKQTIKELEELDKKKAELLEKIRSETKLPISRGSAGFSDVELEYIKLKVEKD